MKMKRLKQFLKSDKFRELFVYCVVGGLTTAVNYVSYIAVTRGIGAAMDIAPDHAGMILAASIISWALSVAFAFWANKIYVFRSKNWDSATLRHELPGFIAARVLSLGFDAAFMEIAVHLLGMNDLIAKLASNVIVVIMNYFASKFWIFKKKG